MNPLEQSSREQISALADGALHGEAMAHAVDALCTDRAMQQVWQDHHAIGDMLRAGTRQPCTESSAFLSRFQQRLAAETLPYSGSDAESTSSVVPFPHRKPATVAPVEAANEPVFRWKLVSGVASLAAVAAIGWNLVGGQAGSSATDAQRAQQQVQMPVQVASRDASRMLIDTRPSVASGASGQQPEPTRVAAGGGEPQVMLRDARLDQLLEAHRQAGGAAQMPSGFLRNATFDGPSR